MALDLRRPLAKPMSAEARAASQERTFTYPRSSASLPAKAYPAKASAYRQVGVG